MFILQQALNKSVVDTGVISIDDTGVISIDVTYLLRRHIEEV